MTTVAVIPVKQLENVKQRLGAVLTAAQRQALFTAMFEDVLEAASSCDRIDRLIVVTNDARVAELAATYGAEIREEPVPSGLVEAVTAMGHQLAKEEVGTMVFLPADVPLVSVEELEVVLDGFGRSGEAEVMIVPSHDLGGSNCIASSPPDCMRFGFGEDSFRRHLAFARELGIKAAVARLPGLGLDIDTPEDLRRCLTRLMETGIETHTARLLRQDGITQALRQAG